MFQKIGTFLIIAALPLSLFAQDDIEELEVGDEAPKFALRTLDGKY